MLRFTSNIIITNPSVAVYIKILATAIVSVLVQISPPHSSLGLFPNGWSPSRQRAWYSHSHSISLTNLPHLLAPGEPSHPSALPFCDPVRHCRQSDPKGPVWVVERANLPDSDLQGHGWPVRLYSLWESYSQSPWYDGQARHFVTFRPHSLTARNHRTPSRKNILCPTCLHCILGNGCPRRDHSTAQTWRPCDRG